MRKSNERQIRFSEWIMQTRVPWQFSLTLTWLTLIAVSAAVAAPPDPEFMAAKQTFVKDMKKKSAAARAAAVEELAELVQPESADLLLKRGVTDEDRSVRLAAQKGLRQLAGDQTVGEYLFNELKKSFRKPPANDTVAIEVLRALITTNDESRQEEIVTMLDDFLASPKAHPLVPMTVIDDSALEGDQIALKSVLLLAKAKVFENNFGYRRCIVQALSQIREPEAIGFLIDLLPKTQGLIQHDVITHLTRATSQKFRDNDRNWANWWRENQKDFKFPPAVTPLSDVSLDDQQPTYYGIPICAKRIVFVLDTSMSMRGQPIVLAKQALLKTIESLPEAVKFDIIFFDGATATWQPRLVPASAEAKHEASQIIADRGLKLGTVSNAALNAAFELDPEAIYFVSDGEPTDGQPAQIVNFVSQFNRVRRVSIHTVGVVTIRNGGVGLTSFMQPLADQNYGKFRLVE